MVLLFDSYFWLRHYYKESLEWAFLFNHEMSLVSLLLTLPILKLVHKLKSN